MANELRSRITQKFKDGDTKVRVYNGTLTAKARRASGISGKLEFVDGKGKSRLDRRHHVVDAAVVAFMSNYVAETLALRSNMKFDYELRSGKKSKQKLEHKKPKIGSTRLNSSHRL